MSKRTRASGSQTTKRRLIEGRGQGRGCDYKPWLMIHDVASNGLASRVKSPITGRVCHLMSNLETDWFYAAHAFPGLIDIREQYPLELDETQEIARQLGIVHPRDPKSKEDCVMTTDFVLTVLNRPAEVDMAIAIKSSTDLSSPRTLEKLEIERIYWSARKVDWRILTEKELPRALVKNLRWLFPHLDLLESGNFTREQIAQIRSVMEPSLLEGISSVVDIASSCDDKLGFQAGSSLSVARYLIGTGVWPVDLHVVIDPRRPLPYLEKGGMNAIAPKHAA